MKRGRGAFRASGADLAAITAQEKAGSADKAAAVMAAEADREVFAKEILSAIIFATTAMNFAIESRRSAEIETRTLRTIPIRNKIYFGLARH